MHRYNRGAFIILMPFLKNGAFFIKREDLLLYISNYNPNVFFKFVFLLFWFKIKTWKHYKEIIEL